jgi:hypothetical protein
MDEVNRLFAPHSRATNISRRAVASVELDGVGPLQLSLHSTNAQLGAQVEKALAPLLDRSWSASD